MYVPSFYEPHYADDGSLAGYRVDASVDAPLDLLFGLDVPPWCSTDF